VLAELVRETADLTASLASAEGRVADALGAEAEGEGEASRRPAVEAQRLRAALEQEVARWCDSALPAAVLAAAARPEFAGELARCLQAAGSAALEPLHAALRPSGQQMNDTLKVHLTELCSEFVAPRLTGGLRGRGARQRKQAVEAALQELAAQLATQLDGRLASDRASAGRRGPQLARACTDGTIAAVRAEVQSFEAALGRLTEALPEPPAASQRPQPRPPALEVEAARRRFVAELSSAVAPLERDLDELAESVRSTGSVLERCRAIVEAAEAEAKHVVGPAAGDVDAQAALFERFMDERARISADISVGRTRDALERALVWDAGHHLVTRQRGPESESTAALTEVACELLAARYDKELDGTDELLQHDAVASHMDGRLRILVLAQLLYCAVLPGTDLARLSFNLEWAVALLALVGGDEDGIAEVLASVGPRATEVLEALQTGHRPPSLASALAPERRRTALSAKLALKGLGLLVRNAR